MKKEEINAEMNLIRNLKMAKKEELGQLEVENYKRNVKLFEVHSSYNMLEERLKYLNGLIENGEAE